MGGTLSVVCCRMFLISGISHHVGGSRTAVVTTMETTGQAHQINIFIFLGVNIIHSGVLYLESCTQWNL